MRKGHGGLGGAVRWAGSGTGDAKPEVEARSRMGRRANGTNPGPAAPNPTANRYRAISARNSSPKRSSFAWPTPFTSKNSASVRGRRSHMSRSVASENTM